MALDTLSEPKTLPTVVGIAEENAPLHAPLSTTKAMRLAVVVERGHKMSIVSALAVSAHRSVFAAPNRSLTHPEMMRPAAEAKLKPATRNAPVLGPIPSERL